jgi:hypothetical protein
MNVFVPSELKLKLESIEAAEANQTRMRQTMPKDYCPNGLIDR